MVMRLFFFSSLILDHSFIKVNQIATIRIVSNVFVPGYLIEKKRKRIKDNNN